MKVRELLFLLLCTALFGACTHGEMQRRLAEVDSLTDAHYDSALVLLARMDSLPMRHADRMYLELLRGKAMNKASVPFTTDSVMRRVAAYYDHHGSPNRRLLAHYVLGCAYRDLGSAPRALEEYQRAVSLADTTRADCDLSTLMRAHSQMADLYIRMRLPELEKIEEEQAMTLAYKMGDTLSALIFAEAQCNALYNKGEYRACIKQATRIREEYLKHGFTREANVIQVLYVKSFIALEEYPQAKQYLTRLQNDSILRADPRRINGGQGILHIYEGQCYLGVGKADSAETSFRNALPYSRQRNNALLAYSGLAQAYSQLHQSDSLMKYTALYSEAKEHSYHENAGRIALQMAAMYDYSLEQRKAKEQTERANLWKVRAYILVSLILVCGYYIWMKRKRASRLLRELRQKITEIDALKMKEAKTADDIRAKDEQILKMKGQVEYLCLELKNDESRQQDVPLTQTIIVSNFRDYLYSSKTIDEGDWKKLSDTVCKYCPAFLPFVGGEKKLSKNAYRLCLLILCGFEPSQIDDILGMKHSYSSKTRLRLNQKVFGTPGTAADFDRKLRLLL